MLGCMRANRLWCGRLALFALALQLYLSFGHIHAEDLGVAPPAAVAAQPGGSTHEGGSGPADDDDHDICAICVALSLTASSVIPVVAPLVLPIASDFTWALPTGLPRFDVQFAASFRARAPPYG